MPVHSAMTDPEVHEPKDITTAASGTVYVADGLGSGTWTVSVNQDAPSDDIPYSRINGDWKPAPVNPVDSYWRADTTGVAAPPGTGDIIWNNATQSLATHIFISKDTTLGVDKRPEMLNYVQDYDTLTLYEAGSPNVFQRWKLTNAVDGTSYIDYTVELIAANGGNISDNTETIVTFQANLVDTVIDDFLTDIAAATADQIYVADGAGSGEFKEPTDVFGINHSVAYISGNTQAITVTTGGTYYQVKHASITWTEKDSEGSISWNDTDKAFDISVAGDYMVTASGSWAGNTTGDVIGLLFCVDTTIADAGKDTSSVVKKQLPTASLRSHEPFAIQLYFTAGIGDKVAPMVTSTTNGATVTITDMHLICELVHTP